MRTHHTSLIARIVVATLVLLALIPATGTAAVQTAETSYTDETHGVTVSWTDQWVADPPTEESSLLGLTRDKSITVLISILDGTVVSPEDAVWFLYAEGDEILDDRSTENPPSLTLIMQEAGLVYTVEAYSLNDGETTVLVAVGTVPVLQESAIGIVQQEITLNDSPVMTGQPLDDTGATTASSTPEANTRTSRTERGSTETIDTTDATAEVTDRSDRISRSSRENRETPESTEVADPTEESTTEVSRTSRTTTGTSETPEVTEEATEEPTTEITRTSRTGSGGTETPEATDEPTIEATEEPTETVVPPNEPGTFTGTVWGYIFTYDTGLWEQSSTYDTPTVDGVRLDGESSTVSFMGLSDYGADPVACLIGEDEYYGAESESISNWELATDANGDPLWYESDELAWGVFSYTFHSSSGTDVEFVDYISCETIPGEDAVLVVQMTSFPDEYNTNLDAVLDILESLEFQP